MRALSFNGSLGTAVSDNQGLPVVKSFCTTEPGRINVGNSGSIAGSEAACNPLPTLQYGARVSFPSMPLFDALLPDVGFFRLDHLQ
jgi:hypothetical protein